MPVKLLLLVLSLFSLLLLLLRSLEERNWFRAKADATAPRAAEMATVGVGPGMRVAVHVFYYWCCVGAGNDQERWWWKRGRDDS